MSIISKNCIQNVDNYNLSFQDTCTTIFAKYLLLINEYLKHCLDNIYIQNQVYYTYVIKKCISTLNHVFKILLLYTKNLDLIYYNCQKSYIYYIEFIGQIGEENHSFLQLNSKDATLFVYKKTIFDIPNDIRKDYISDDLDKKLVNNVDSMIKIYNTILYKYIDNNSVITDIIKYSGTELQNSMLKIIKIFIEANNSNQDITNKINAIMSFILYFKNENILEHLDILVKKLKNKGKPFDIKGDSFESSQAYTALNIILG